MRFELFVALRYLTAKRKQAVISLISAISILGIAAGVMALIIALALSTGFKEEIQSKILGATAHINVMRFDGSGIEGYRQVMSKLAGLEHIVHVQPAIYDQAFLSGKGGGRGVVVKGIDPAQERGSLGIMRHIVEGDPSQLAQSESQGGRTVDGIILGKELAKTVGAKLNDYVMVTSPKGLLSPFGMLPRWRKFKVIAIFESGLWDHDLSWAYISIPAAQRLFDIKQDAVTVIECRVDDIYKVEEICDLIRGSLGASFITSNWIELNRPLFSALKLEKLAMFVAIGLVIFVASLNIITTLIMMVLDKQRDIAILSAMGATEKTIMWVFILQGLIIGVIGTVIGSVAGISACSFLDSYKVIRLEPEVYSIPYVPFKVKPLDFTLVAFLAVLISFLATIYPARSAARLNPVEVLRYE